MRKLFFIWIFWISASNLLAQDVSIDATCEKVLNQFMEALMIENADESAKEVMKFAHKSLYNASGTDLSKDLRSFSFKKAHDNAKFYQIPVKITRVRKTGVTAIGYGDTAEKGTVYDYFIAKRVGVNGMPAPIKVFLPANGGEPKISYMGSL
jgi:hypothetical protein